MSRVTKSPEERKAEIMDAALELFNSRGYEETAVSDIVQKVGVAQGTFYYYFKSKEEVLQALLERYVEDFQAGLAEIIRHPRRGTREKLQQVIDEFFFFEQEFEQEKDPLFSFLKKEDNVLMRQRIVTKTIQRLTPLFRELLEQGRREGIFRVDYPEETTEVLLMVVRHYQVALRHFLDRETLRRKLRGLEEVLKRLLGAEEDAFYLVERPAGEQREADNDGSAPDHRPRGKR